MAQSSASFAMFTLRPSPPFPLILQNTPVTSSVLTVTSHLRLCHPPAAVQLRSGLPVMQGSFLATPVTWGEHLRSPLRTSSNLSRSTQSHDSPTGLRRLGGGSMDHAASYPGERGREQGSPISPTHSQDTDFCQVLGVRGHQWSHCQPHKDDTAGPSSSPPYSASQRSLHHTLMRNKSTSMSLLALISNLRFVPTAPLSLTGWHGLALLPRRGL